MSDIRRSLNIIESTMLNEISRPATRVDADAVLRKAGYQRLGDGAFGAVYQKPGKSYVVKVFSANDHAYLSFLNLVKAHQDNPHFPKLYDKMAKVTPEYCAIRMEPLQPYKYNPDLVENYMRLRDESLTKGGYSWLALEDAREYMEYNPKFKEACDLIIDNLLSKYELDVQKDNLMMRGDTVVFIDPVKDPGSFDGVHLPFVPTSNPNPSPTNPADIEDLLRQLYQ